MLYESNFIPLMSVIADTEQEAWNQIKQAGMRNNSKLFTLMEIG